MNEVTKAARELGAFFKACSHVVPALEKLGKLEQMGDEIKSRVSILKAEADGLELKIEDMQEAVKDAEEKRAKAVKDADDMKKRMDASAKEEIERAVKIANDHAGKILADAETRRKTIDTDTENEKRSLQDIRRQTNEARAELKAVKDELARIKERIGA